MDVIKLIAVAAFACVLTACNTTPYDYTALEESKPRSILVIPPMNDTVEVSAPYTFLSTISKPLAEKGYYVFPVAVIDSFMKENGLPTPAEMNAVPLDKLRENIGADAVLYVNIDAWGQKYRVVSSQAVTSATLKLVDARTGELLWDARAEAVEGDDGGNEAGLAGLLVKAVVKQIVGSMLDQTQRLSSLGNARAVNNLSQGLKPGPYRQQETQ